MKVELFGSITVPLRMAAVIGLIICQTAPSSAQTIDSNDNTVYSARPPANYPTGDVVCTTGLLKGNKITRRGFYDADRDEGFGHDKASYKHGIKSCIWPELNKTGMTDVFHVYFSYERCH
jgi:hypothetical protein